MSAGKPLYMLQTLWILYRLTSSLFYSCFFVQMQIILLVKGRVSSISFSTSVAFSFLSRIFKGPTSSQVFVAPEFREVSVFSLLSVLWILQSSALFRMSQTRPSGKLCHWGSTKQAFSQCSAGVSSRYSSWQLTGGASSHLAFSSDNGLSILKETHEKTV